MSLPGCRSRSQKKTPGPERESTWPAMTADPVAPGDGLPVYQPTTVVLLGTWSVPLGFRPRVVTGARIPMAGMVSSTGLGTGWAAGCQVVVTGRPEGVATGDGLAGSRWAEAGEPLAKIRPTAPAPAASTPTLSAAADTSRSRVRRGGTPAREPGGAAPGRRARLTPGRRRESHKVTVVDRIWLQDGSWPARGGVPGAAAGGGGGPPRAGGGGGGPPRTGGRAGGPRRPRDGSGQRR